MVRILTDSTSSIPAAIRAALGIDVLSLRVLRGAAEYEESTMDLDAFYTDIYDMIDDIPTSSQPSPAQVEAELESAAQKGENVLGIFISSKMSGTFESVLAAAQRVKERFPEFRFAMMDSMSNCMDLGWAAMAAAGTRNEGGTLEQCVAAAKKAIESSRFIFAPESLRFLEKGGRIGHAAALLGSVLKISPVLTVQDGVATTLTKARTQTRALEQIVNTFKADAAEHGVKNVAVHYIGSKLPAAKWAKDVIEPLLGHEVLVTPASPVIGVHVGPAMGLVYECLEPVRGKLVHTKPEIVLA